MVLPYQVDITNGGVEKVPNKPKLAFAKFLTTILRVRIF
jgi:hypothetical protein